MNVADHIRRLRTEVAALQVQIGPPQSQPAGTEHPVELLKLDLQYVDNWLRHAQVDIQRSGLAT